MPRIEVKIPALFRYGATVFLNRGGGVTVEQITDYDGEGRLVFDLDEAEQVASAILEVVMATRQSRSEGYDGTT